MITFTDLVCEWITFLTKSSKVGSLVTVIVLKYAFVLGHQVVKVEDLSTLVDDLGRDLL